MTTISPSISPTKGISSSETQTTGACRLGESTLSTGVSEPAASTSSEREDRFEKAAGPRSSATPKTGQSACQTSDASLTSDLEARRQQAHLQGPAATPKSSGFFEEAKRTACLVGNGLLGDAVCAPDPTPAIEEAIAADPELGKPTLSPTEAAELVSAGNQEIFPEWMLKAGPDLDVSHIIREGQTYDNGYKDWYRKDADTQRWQRYVGPEDGKGFPGNGVPPGEGIPVADDFDVYSLPSR